MTKEKKYSIFRNISIPTKINFTVGIGFVLVIMIVSSYIFYQDRARFLDLAIERATDLTTLYFDSLNTMMLTGTMSERKILQDKMMRRPHVLDIRVIRGQPVKQQFGPGFDFEQPEDELDLRVLQGEEIVQIENTAQGRVVTVLTPFAATSNTRGVNCLQCHNVESGAINGGIRVTYSLAYMDESLVTEVAEEAVANLIFLFS